LTQWTRKSAGTIRSRFAVLFLMLAVLLQAGVIQTHNHLAADVVTANDAIGAPINLAVASVTPSGKSRPTSPPVCPLCEEQALFGSYMLGAPAIVVAPVATVAWYSPVPIFSSIGRQVSHAWRSRAPPTA